MPKVKIDDITKRTAEHFEVIGTITRKERTQRSMTKAHALSTLTDDTGSILLNLWRNQVDQVNVGDTIRLKDAFTHRYKGKIQLSTWEEKIEVLSKSNRESSSIA